MWRRSWTLVKTSWAVIRSDKELLWLPVLSGLATLIVIASFAVPVVLTASRTDVNGTTQFSMSPLGYVLIAGAYLVLAYVTIFFRTAMVSAAAERLDGGDPSLGSALAGAGKRAGRIMPWAIVSATVSVILRAASERAGFVGQIVISIIGMAWALITFLVLPIVVFEEIGVFAAIKRSAELFKRTWGENMIGNGGIGILGLVIVLPAFAVGAAGVALAGSGVAVLGLPLAAAAVIAVLFAMVLVSALGAVFQTVLYRYASTGQVGGGFTQEQLEQAFRPRRRGSRR